MHRTYSMRSTRAPTASQIQNPPPPPSSTKSGRLFGKGGLGECGCARLLPRNLRCCWAGHSWLGVNRRFRTCPPPEHRRRLWA
ncbi:hypothetical protein VTG60DRAFT_5474 [Thermothelomyces hinnuleus]